MGKAVGILGSPAEVLWSSLYNILERHWPHQNVMVPKSMTHQEGTIL